MGSLPLNHLCIIFLIAICCNISYGYSNEGGDSQKTSIRLEHSLDGKTWRHRATISFRASSAFGISDAKKTQQSITIEQEKLGARDIASLVELAERGGLYKIRHSSPSTHSYAMASVPACSLFSSNFVDEIGIQMSMIKPVGVSLHVPEPECLFPIIAPSNPEWKTSAFIGFGDETIRPTLDNKARSNTINPIPGAEQSQQEEEGSWFSRNWHYLLPIPILLVINLFLGMGGSQGN